MSKLMTLSADETTAVVTDATIGDIFGTMTSTTQAVSGMYGLAQKLIIGAAGATLQNARLGNGYNIFKGA